jgi:hypothetical protein
MRLSTAVFVQAMDTIACPHWWYHRIVDYYATVFWLAGAADWFIHEIEAITEQCQLPTLDEGLGRILAQVYPSPYDQYLLTVSLGAFGLWRAGAGDRLLATLRSLVDDGPPS